MTQFLLFESASVSENQPGTAHLAQTPNWSMHIAGRPRTGSWQDTVKIKRRNKAPGGAAGNMQPPSALAAQAEAASAASQH